MSGQNDAIMFTAVVRGRHYVGGFPGGVPAAEIHAAVKLFGLDEAARIFPRLSRRTIQYVTERIPERETFGPPHVYNPIRALIERVEQARARQEAAR